MTTDTPRSPSDRPRHYRVLVADDDERSLDSLVSLLDRDGFAIEPAHCGHEALVRLGLREASRKPEFPDPPLGTHDLEVGRSEGRRPVPPARPRFDFLVLDYNMPDFTGVEVLRRIRIGLGVPLPAILVSGDYSRELRRLWNEVGGFALLPKPVEPEDFRSQVQELVRRFLGGR